MTAPRRKRDPQEVARFPRTSRINERYYARDNQPSWPQLTNRWHFEDARGRQYTIAEQHGEPFENERLRFAPKPAPPQCVADHRGAVTLWVRLPRLATWYEERDDDMLVLRERRSHQRYLVRLDARLKYSPKRRSGTVIVSGLGRTLCNLLLSEHAAPAKKGI